MAKQLLFSEDARKKLLSGVEQISKAVKTTLGPCGRMVMLDKKYGAPTITKDGVSVAKDIELGQSGRVSYRTRVGNLFLAGQSVNSHGIMGVLVGSMVVCDSILGNGILYDEIIKASK